MRRGTAFGEATMIAGIAALAFATPEAALLADVSSLVQRAAEVSAALDLLALPTQNESECPLPSCTSCTACLGTEELNSAEACDRSGGLWCGAVSTTLSTEAHQGTLTLMVPSTLGFNKGDTISLGIGNSLETNKIAGTGSYRMLARAKASSATEAIFLEDALQHSHSSGATLGKVVGFEPARSEGTTLHACASCNGCYKCDPTFDLAQCSASGHRWCGLEHPSTYSHFTNVAGEQFNMLRASNQTILQIPRHPTDRPPLLRVEAHFRQVEPNCTAVHASSISLTGQWFGDVGDVEFSTRTGEFETPRTFGLRVGKANALSFAEFGAHLPPVPGGPRANVLELPSPLHQPPGSPGDRSRVRTLAVELQLAKVITLKVEWIFQRLPEGDVNYLDLTASHLAAARLNVGGLLGYDSHSWASELGHCEEQAQQPAQSVHPNRIRGSSGSTMRAFLK